MIERCQPLCRANLGRVESRSAARRPGPPPSAFRRERQWQSGPAEGMPVTVAAAVQKAVPVHVPAIGNVQAISTVSVKRRGDSQVLHVHFTEGQDVKKGDLLLTLDQHPFQADLQRAKANLAMDLTEMRNAQAQARRYAAVM